MRGWHKELNSNNQHLNSIYNFQTVALRSLTSLWWAMLWTTMNTSETWMWVAQAFVPRELKLWIIDLDNLAKLILEFCQHSSASFHAWNLKWFLYLQHICVINDAGKLKYKIQENNHQWFLARHGNLCQNEADATATWLAHGTASSPLPALPLLYEWTLDECKPREEYVNIPRDMLYFPSLITLNSQSLQPGPYAD